MQWSRRTRQNEVELPLDVDQLATCRGYACNRYVSESFEIYVERTKESVHVPEVSGVKGCHGPMHGGSNHDARRHPFNVEEVT